MTDHQRKSGNGKPQNKMENGSISERKNAGAETQGRKEREKYQRSDREIISESHSGRGGWSDGYREQEILKQKQREQEERRETDQEDGAQREKIQTDRADQSEILEQSVSDFRSGTKIVERAGNAVVQAERAAVSNAENGENAALFGAGKIGGAASAVSGVLSHSGANAAYNRVMDHAFTVADAAEALDKAFTEGKLQSRFFRVRGKRSFTVWSRPECQRCWRKRR